MTGPTGSEHVSRYKAVGEFDGLIRAANEARLALRRLRDEEAKLNRESLEDDKKILASRAQRIKTEQETANSIRKTTEEINRNNKANQDGHNAGVQYVRGVGQGARAQANSSDTQKIIDAITGALEKGFNEAGKKAGDSFNKGVRASSAAQGSNTSSTLTQSLEQARKAYEQAGQQSGAQFNIGVRETFRRDKDGILQSTGFSYTLREAVNKFGASGEQSGKAFVEGTARRLVNLNSTLRGIGIQNIDLDVDADDALANLAELKTQLEILSHMVADPEVRIDANKALNDIKYLQRVLRDDVAEAMIKDAQRIRVELEKVGNLPSGKALKFWSLTAISDMTKVFQEAERGVGVFTRLKMAFAAAGGGREGGNVLSGLIAGFDGLSSASSNLLQRLGRVSGELYRMPGIIAVLIAAIPALISGLGALGGSALAVANGLGAIGGVVLTLPGLISAAVGSIGALSSAFGDLKDVLKEAKKAQTDELYAKEQSRLGTEKALTPLQKYKALINAMLPATQTATLAIVDFSDAWENTSERIGENFFQQIVGSVSNLAELLPIAENFFGKSATALGKVADEGLRMITSGPWKADFATIADNNAKLIDNFGHAGLALADSFRNIAIAAEPFTTWITKAIREGAENFADWSAQARSDRSIEAFLAETQESLQITWQILKNLGRTISSLFKSTVDEGQSYLRTLESITDHWADVTKAQEAANSPLRQWMTQIRPVLSALGALIGDLARGIAGLSSNQSSITAMVDLLDSLRTDVLPPLLSILQSLNDSGIANTVVEALGTLLDAISDFLNSGATQALRVFVTVLANFAEIVLGIASAPGISHVLGALTTGLATVAAVSVVARFTGLFKLWDFLTWMTKNRSNLSGAFADAARGVAGLERRGDGGTISSIPSSVGGIGNEVINNQARAFDRVGTAAQTSATRVGVFSRALSGIAAAGGAARTGLVSLGNFLGGPWGIALTVATVAATVLFTTLTKQKTEAKETADALNSLRTAYESLNSGSTETVAGLAESNEKVKEIIATSARYGIAIKDVSGVLNNQEQSVSRFTEQIDSEIAALERSLAIRKANSSGLDFETLNREKALEAAKAYKAEILGAAKAQLDQNNLIGQGAVVVRTYQERLAGLTQAQVDTSVSGQDMSSAISTLSRALDTMSSATATSTERSRALSDVIDYYKSPLERANEAAETWSATLLSLKESVDGASTSLSIKTREGLRNRDALEAAAKATRDLYLEDIASGTPMDQALKRHQDRIKELENEATKTYGQKKAVKELIDTYGDIPENMKTNIIADEKGFAAVYVELAKLSVMQKALQEGKSLDEAQTAWNKESNKFYQRYIPGVNGDGYGAPGYATGGAVWGAGSKTSDSIRAWLSNGEFVQPADSVDYYGMDIMEAIRKKRLDKATIFEALPDSNNTSFASGGSVHSQNCVSCQSGGHAFATGGSVNVPIKVTPRGTLVDKDWVTAGVGGLGTGGGGKGWQWQMNVLRAAFPGLPLWSGYRPGSRTLSGNQSYHALGRAVDLPPRRDVAQWIRSNYGAQTKELITPYNDLNLHNGQPHTYTGAVWNQHNFAGGNAHDHWAFNQGGMVDLMKMMNINNLGSSQASSLPTTPRTLSPAASSVVNNSTDNARTFGDVIINNPLPERAGDSVRDALYRTSLLY